MGSLLEFNDTLKLKRENLPEKLEPGKIYSFKIEGRRFYHLSPVRVFLVEEIGGKWNYIGHIRIITQTQDALDNITSGKYKVTKLYSPEYVKQVNRNEPPEGKGFSDLPET